MSRLAEVDIADAARVDGRSVAIAGSSSRAPYSGSGSTFVAHAFSAPAEVTEDRRSLRGRAPTTARRRRWPVVVTAPLALFRGQCRARRTVAQLCKVDHHDIAAGQTVELWWPAPSDSSGVPDRRTPVGVPGSTGGGTGECTQPQPSTRTSRRSPRCWPTPDPTQRLRLHHFACNADNHPPQSRHPSARFKVVARFDFEVRHSAGSLTPHAILRDLQAMRTIGTSACTTRNQTVLLGQLPETSSSPISFIPPRRTSCRPFDAASRIEIRTDSYSPALDGAGGTSTVSMMDSPPPGAAFHVFPS